MTDTTLVVTSCSRHDLLKRTLDSLIALNCGGGKPDACIIVESGGVPLPGWLKENIHYYAANLGKIKWVECASAFGPCFALDLAFGRVKTSYVFYCPDDYEFSRGGDWLAESKRILVDDPTAFTVMLGGDGIGDGSVFAPGLRRLSDYRRMGSFIRTVGLHKSKADADHILTAAYKAFGLHFRHYAPSIAAHIGWERPVKAPPVPDGHGGISCACELAPVGMLPKVLIAVPVCHSFDYGRWENEKHVSGPNERIAALRDTWMKDVKPFAGHVDCRLFFGGPPLPFGPLFGADGRLRPLDDEVFLDCEDDYESLPAKTIAICKFAKERDYDWLLKVDDDSAVYVDRVLIELLTHRPDYGGFPWGFLASGMGYWLSRKAFTIIAGLSPDTSVFAEDVTVGKALAKAGIRPVSLVGHSFGKQHYFWKDGYDPETRLDGITVFHAVRPDDMRAWYASFGK